MFFNEVRYWLAYYKAYILNMVKDKKNKKTKKTVNNIFN